MFLAQNFRLLGSMIQRKRYAKPAKRLASSYKSLYDQWRGGGKSAIRDEDDWWKDLLRIAEAEPAAKKAADEMWTKCWHEIIDELNTNVKAMRDGTLIVGGFEEEQGELVMTLLEQEIAWIARAVEDQPIPSAQKPLTVVSTVYRRGDGPGAKRKAAASHEPPTADSPSKAPEASDVGSKEPDLSVAESKPVPKTGVMGRVHDPEPKPIRVTPGR